MSQENPNPPASASSAPASVPAPGAPVSVPAPAPAPSAPANPLQTLADFERYATAALDAQDPALTPAAPPPPATSESPVAPAAPAAPPPSDPPDDVPEPTPEELAQLNEPGQRALKAEREKRRAAREELKTLRAGLERLIATPAPPNPDPDPAAAVPSTPEATPATPPTPPAVPANLAQCRTFDQVDAAVLQATQTQALTHELMLALSAGDRETVIQRLTEQNVKAIGETPVAEASDAQLRQLVVNAHTGCSLTIAQAGQRKETLRREALSFTEAQKILPGLGQANSAEHKAFAAYLQQYPGVRNLGPNWPQMVAEGVAHRLGRTAASVPPVAVPGLPVVTATAPAPRSAPGAPRTSTAAVPARNQLDTLREKIASGQASDKDMRLYAELSLS